MAWGNMKVESVELVQDMSYEKLKERLDSALQKGNFAAKEELCRNFDIAVKAVEMKQSNINECIMQCDESFRILMSNLFLLIYITNDWLKPRLLIELKRECGKNYSERNLQNMAKNCVKKIEEEIKDSYEIYDICGGDNEEWLKREVAPLEMLTDGAGGKSFFEIFVDSVQNLIYNACSSTKKEYKRAFEDSVVRAIYLYADSEHEKIVSNEGKSWGKKLNQLWANVHDIYNSKYNMEIMTTPFTYALNSKEK